MATARLLFFIICLITFNRPLLHAGNPVNEGARIVALARVDLYVREKTGKNDGPEVERYLAYTGFKKGTPWCASFISYLFYTAGYAGPKTAWSPALFPAHRLVKTPMPALVFGIYFAQLKRIAHVGLVEKVKNDWVYTIEGNSSPDGSREGIGVFNRLRHKRTISKYADWIISNDKH